LIEVEVELECRYAMLPLPMATNLEIETPDGVRSARVVSMPFVDPKKQLAKES